MPNTIDVLDAAGVKQTVSTNDAVLAKLPQPGTVAAPSADVVTVQGAAGSTFGAQADAAYADATGAAAGGMIGLLKGAFVKLAALAGAVVTNLVQTQVLPFASADGSGTIAAGGTAQSLFGGATPTNGFAVYNPDPSNDLWISDSATAAANGQGSIRVAANGGGYETPAGYKPIGAVSVVGAVTSQKFTAKRW